MNNKSIIKKVALIIPTFIFSAVPTLTYAVGEDLTAKATNAQSNFFSFLKNFSIPIAAIFLLLLFFLKKTAAATGNSGKEALCTAGIWTVIFAFVGVQWGDPIWNTIKGLFN